MAEPNLVGGRTPTPGAGRTSGGGVGTRVRVDISDVQKLNKALGESSKLVKALAKDIKAIDSKMLKALVKDVGDLKKALGVQGTGGTGGGGSYSRTGSFGGQQRAGGAATYSRPIPGTPSVNLIGDYQPRQSYTQRMHGFMMGSPTRPEDRGPQTRYGAMAMGGLATVATFGTAAVRGHLDDMTSRSYLTNRAVIQQGGIGSYGANQAFSRRVDTAFAGVSTGYGDTTQALGTVMGQYGTSGRFGASAMSGAAALGALDPTRGATGGAQALGAMYTAQNYGTARRLGIDMGLDKGMDPKKFMDQVIAKIEQRMGRKANPVQIQSGYTPGTNMYANLQQFGDETRIAILQYWAAKNAGGDATTISGVMGNAGGTNNLASERQQLGSAKGTLATTADPGMERGYKAALDLQTAAIEKSTKLLENDFSQGLLTATGFLSGFSAALAGATAALAVRGAGSMIRGAGGARGAAGAVGGFVRRHGGKLKGAGIGLVGGLGAGLLNQVVGSDDPDDWRSSRLAKVLGQAAAGAGIGAAAGAPFAGIGAVPGAIAGGIGGALNGLFGGPMDGEVGGPQESTNTVGSIISMAKGVPHRVTSTVRSGKAAITATGNASLHGKGQAVDFAGPKPGRDTKELLAINLHFARKYGAQLDELIYSGPGAVRIKRGRRVDGTKDDYRGVTLAGHHDHVHVGLRKAGGAGGGVAVGTSGASAEGGMASGGGGGMRSSGGGHSSSAFGTTNTGDLLLAALAGSGSPGTGSNAGTAGGNAMEPSAGAAPAGAGGIYTPKQLAQLARSVGFKGDDVLEAVAVAMAESGGRVNATNQNKDRHRSIDKGLWQINSYWHPEVKNPFDPVEAAKAAFRISGGGKNWSPWATWDNGSAQKHMSELRGEIGGPLPSETESPRSGGTLHVSHTGNRGGRTVPVQLVFHVERGTDAEMRAAARKFAHYVEQDHDIEMVAGR